MRTNARHFGRRGRSRCASGGTGGRLAPLAGSLNRMLERRVAEATGRGGRGLSAGDLSAAVVDISRLVTASARLAKLDRPEPEPEAARDPGEELDDLLRGIMRRKARESESGHGDARPVPGETGGGRS